MGTLDKQLTEATCPAGIVWGIALGTHPQQFSEPVLFTNGQIWGRIWNLVFLVIDLADLCLVLLHLMIYEVPRQQK